LVFWVLLVFEAFLGIHKKDAAVQFWDFYGFLVA